MNRLSSEKFNVFNLTSFFQNSTRKRPSTETYPNMPAEKVRKVPVPCRKRPQSEVPDKNAQQHEPKPLNENLVQMEKERRTFGPLQDPTYPLSPLDLHSNPPEQL